MRILMIILGLLFGSLGSVILTRFADGVTRKKLRGFFFGRSQCPHCKHTLGIADLIPVLSYLFHGGRCRYCGGKISRIYPVLELLSAGIFLGTYLWMGEFGRGIIIFWLLTNRLLLLLLVYDIQKYELHMSIRTLLVAMGILGNILLPNANLLNALFASIAFVGVFLLIYMFAKRYVQLRFGTKGEGFGEGDIYLSLIVGLYIPIIFGFQNILFSGSILIKILVLFVLMSSIIGLIRAGIHYLLNGQLTINNGKGNVHSQFSILNSQCKIIPFFPAMIIAFWLLAWKAQYFITLIFG